MVDLLIVVWWDSEVTAFHPCSRVGELKTGLHPPRVSVDLGCNFDLMVEEGKASPPKWRMDQVYLVPGNLEEAPARISWLEVCSPCQFLLGLLCCYVCESGKLNVSLCRIPKRSSPFADLVTSALIPLLPVFPPPVPCEDDE